MATNINYQQIYEEELSHTVRDSLERSERFFELSHQDRMLIEELIDLGYKRAVEDALDPEVLQETAALAGEMGTQLYNFANLLQDYVSAQGIEDDD
jgi:hypothetical protein